MEFVINEIEEDDKEYLYLSLDDMDSDNFLLTGIEIAEYLDLSYEEYSKICKKHNGRNCLKDGDIYFKNKKDEQCFTMDTL